MGSVTARQMNEQIDELKYDQQSKHAQKLDPFFVDNDAAAQQ